MRVDGATRERLKYHGLANDRRISSVGFANQQPNLSNFYAMILT